MVQYFRLSGLLYIEAKYHVILSTFGEIDHSSYDNCQNQYDQKNHDSDTNLNSLISFGRYASILRCRNKRPLFLHRWRKSTMI